MLFDIPKEECTYMQPHMSYAGKERVNDVPMALKSATKML